MQVPALQEPHRRHIHYYPQYSLLKYKWRDNTSTHSIFMCPLSSCILISLLVRFVTAVSTLSYAVFVNLCSLQRQDVLHHTHHPKAARFAHIVQSMIEMQVNT